MEQLPILVDRMHCHGQIYGCHGTRGVHETLGDAGEGGNRRRLTTVPMTDIRLDYSAPTSFLQYFRHDVDIDVPSRKIRYCSGRRDLSDDFAVTGE